MNASCGIDRQARMRLDLIEAARPCVPPQDCALSYAPPLAAISTSPGDVDALCPFGKRARATRRAGFLGRRGASQLTA